MQINPVCVVLPGDVIEQIDLKQDPKTVLGPGLRREGDRVYSFKAGVLYKKEPKTFWIDNHQKRYVPVRGENVVGIITQKAGDYFKVDMGTSELASLSYMAFENATKKNRPNVKVGDAIYAKILVANKDMESELVCVDSHGKKGKLGVIENGFVFTCGLHLARRILNPNCPLLSLLSNEIPFEIAVGMNGKIWINARTVKETVAVGNTILAAEFLPDEKLKALCKNISSLLSVQS